MFIDIKAKEWILKWSHLIGINKKGMNNIFSLHDYISGKLKNVNGKTSTISEFHEVVNYEINTWKSIAFLY